MENNRPVSDLENYRCVLDEVSSKNPVYLTVNGVKKFVIREISDDEEFERTKTLVELMCELNVGKLTGETLGYTSESAVRLLFKK